MIDKFSFIHTADWHFWDKHKFSIDNSRLKKLYDNAMYIVKYAIKKKVDLIIIAGDITELSNPDEKIFKYLTKIFKYAIDNGVKIRIINGNHDTDGLTHSLESLQNILSSIDNDMIKIYSFDIEGKRDNVSYMEFFGNNNFKIPVQFVPYQKDVIGAIKSASELCKKYNMNFGKRILATHCSVNGARASNGKMLKSNVKRKLFKIWDYVALGDHHSHQKLAKGIYYPGSIIRLNRGERDDQKSFIHVTAIKGQKLKIKRIPLHDIELINCKIKYSNISSNIKKITSINGKSVKGAMVTVNIIGDIGTGEKVVKLKNALYNGGAAEVFPKFSNKLKFAKGIDGKKIKLSFDVTESCERFAKSKNLGKDYVKYGIDKINSVR